MSIRIKLDTGEFLYFENVEDYAKFLVFNGHRYEYEVIGEVPKIPYSSLMRKYASMAQRLRSNRLRKQKIKNT
ncbi:hypothetical protein APT65_00100 [Trabzonvirus APT65]|uniref:Uncharacterized protein n=1 Tax=Aeromonas phage APT65 TaxID=2982914 RepID=A0A9E8GAL9_9CAUD|nr:hypothetical protein APT65_00100 [Aeromonas phage APT65]